MSLTAPVAEQFAQSGLLQACGAPLKRYPYLREPLDYSRHAAIHRSLVASYK